MFQPSIFRCKLAVGHLPKKNASEASPNSSTARSVLLMEGTHKLTFMDIHWFSCLLAGSKIDGSVKYPSLEEIVNGSKVRLTTWYRKYTIIYRVLAPSQVVVTDFWTINSVLRFTQKKGTTNLFTFPLASWNLGGPIYNWNIPPIYSWYIGIITHLLSL